MNVDDAPAYGRVAKAFHWAIALLIALMFAIGWTMDSENRDADSINAVDIHMTLGVVIMVLVVLRFIWRLKNPPPPMPDHMSRFGCLTAQCGHAALYVLTFTIPAVGLSMSILEGEGSLFFGLISLEPGPAESEDAAELLGSLHKWLGWGFLAMFAGHLGAALSHQYVIRDDVLSRMMPSIRS